jgi:homoserine/homoserine lactone efflux protein
VSTGTWIAFATATLAATGSPGPNALLIVRNTARYGLRSAVVTLTGNLSSRIMLASGIMLGLSALLGASPLLVMSMRLGGALYLIYLGAKAFRVCRVRTSALSGVPATRSRRTLFLEATAVSAANPNTLGFFAAAIPQLIDTHTPMLPQLGTLLCVDAGMVVIVMSSYALATHLLHRKIAEQGRLLLVRRSGGAVLIVVGLTMLPLPQLV